MSTKQALARRQFIRSVAVGAAAGATLVNQASAQTAAAAEAAPELNVGADPAEANRPPFAAPSAVRPLHIADPNDLEAEARKVMDPGAFAFISSGADSQWTLHENRKAFDRLALEPQYLVGKAAPDLRTTLLGQSLSMPIITTAMGAHDLAGARARRPCRPAAGRAGSRAPGQT